MSLAYWVSSAITVMSSLVSLGYAIASLMAAQREKREGFMYAFARSLALAAVAVIAPLALGEPGLIAVAIAMIIVQSADAIIGGIIRDRIKTVGPAATAVANLAALMWVLLS